MTQVRFRPSDVFRCQASSCSLAWLSGSACLLGEFMLETPTTLIFLLFQGTHPEEDCSDDIAVGSNLKGGSAEAESTRQNKAGVLRVAN
jgi:hypothetical protein